MGWLHFGLLLNLAALGAASAWTEEGPVGQAETRNGFSDFRNGDRKSSSEESLRHLVKSLLGRIERQDKTLQLLDRRVKDNEEELKRKEGMIRDIARDLKRKEGKIRDNEEDLKRKEIRIDQLEQELKSESKHALDPSEKRHIGLQDDVSNSSWLRENSSGDVNETTSQMKPIKKYDEGQSSRSARVSPTSGVEAFSVSIRGGDLYLHPGLVIVFDKVLLDVDGHYNTGDGIYTVPVTGVYVFTWHTTGVTATHVLTELVINGSARGTIIADTEPGHAYDSTTGLVVTSATAGDHVFIRSKGSGTLHNSDIHGKAMFSGWRLS